MVGGDWNLHAEMTTAVDVMNQLRLLQYKPGPDWLLNLPSVVHTPPPSSMWCIHVQFTASELDFVCVCYYKPA